MVAPTQLALSSFVLLVALVRVALGNSSNVASGGHRMSGEQYESSELLEILQIVSRIQSYAYEIRAYTAG